MRGALVLALLCAMGASAHGHIGPSVRENNRYIKVTALGRRVRLLYTYYLGEVPGQQTRRRLDANRDGVVDDDEQARFGAEIAHTVAANLALSIDGRAVAVAFDEVHVGIGTPTTQAGAFSVDLVAWLCLDAAATSHALVLFDHWKAPDPGEIELRVEESPGVEVTRSTFGADGTVSQMQFQWVEAGAPGADPRPLDQLGFHLAFTVDPAKADMAAGACGEAPGSRGARALPMLWIGLGLGLGLAFGVAAWRYRKTKG